MQHISPTTIRASTNLQTFLKKQAITGQRTVKLLTDAHNPINNPAVQIADPRKLNILLLRNYTTDRRTISHHDGDIFSYHQETPF